MQHESDDSATVHSCGSLEDFCLIVNVYKKLITRKYQNGIKNLTFYKDPPGDELRGARNRDSQLYRRTYVLHFEVFWGRGVGQKRKFTLIEILEEGFGVRK